MQFRFALHGLLVTFLLPCARPAAAVVYTFGHGAAPFGFDTDPASHHEGSAAAASAANVETGYEFYKRWAADGFPRMVAVALEHASAYFVESYAVNSANSGPWGDALTWTSFI